MNDLTINCPQCGVAIQLTETLAGPFLEAERRKLDALKREQEAALARREAAVQEKLAAAERAKGEVEAQMAAREKQLRESITKEETRKAGEAASAQLQAMREELAQKSARLAEAQQAELVVRKERQQLVEERERFELEKQRAIDAERGKIREATQRETQEQHRLRDLEKDKVIGDLKVRLEEMQRRMEQGSQQLQGEVQELDLEATLRAAFPHDLIEPVAKGQYGGDVLQRVVGPGQKVVGTIIWESKRTKNWSDGWLGKLKGDQREARADFAIILTAAMPRGCETFVEMEGVWVTSSACAIPLTHALRGALNEIARARSAAEGQQTKKELVYAYLSGPGFRRRVEAIKEAFDGMLADLETEKRQIQKQWAKREVQIRTVIDSTVGLYGDVQGIAGRSVPEIEGLGLPALEGPTITVKGAQGDAAAQGA